MAGSSLQTLSQLLANSQSSVLPVRVARAGLHREGQVIWASGGEKDPDERGQGKGTSDHRE